MKYGEVGHPRSQAPIRRIAVCKDGAIHLARGGWAVCGVRTSTPTAKRHKKRLCVSCRRLERRGVSTAVATTRQNLHLSAQPRVLPTKVDVATKRKRRNRGLRLFLEVVGKVRDSFQGERSKKHVRDLHHMRQGRRPGL